MQKGFIMNNTLTLLFTGDFCPRGRVAELCRQGQSDRVLAPIREVLRNKDLSITNLECPICDIPAKASKTGPVLSVPHECVQLLTDGDFDIVSLANNHILDKGEEGILHTMALLEKAGKTMIGGGRNLQEATKTQFIEQNGIRLALIAAADEEFCIAGDHEAGAAPLRTIDICLQIQEAQKLGADRIILYLHSGHEKYPLPSPEHQKKYRFFADAGASAIVAHHSHIASGYEVYHGVPIFYSLGNFLFDYSVNRRDWAESFLLRIKIAKTGPVDFELIPIVQCDELPEVRLMNEAEKAPFLKALEQRCAIIAHPEQVLEHWNSFTRNRLASYFSKTYGYGRIRRKLMKMGILKPDFNRNLRYLQLLNCLRSEVHREAFLDAIKNNLK